MAAGKAVVNIPGLCRCCHAKGSYRDLTTEYPSLSGIEVYADMLLQCFNVNTSLYEDAPAHFNMICEVCIVQLRTACHFKKQVMDAEVKFLDILQAYRQSETKVSVYDGDLDINLKDCADDTDDLGDEYSEDLDLYYSDEELEEDKLKINTLSLQIKERSDFFAILNCNVEVQDIRDKLLCLQCGKWSLTSKKLQLHMRTHHTPLIIQPNTETSLQIDPHTETTETNQIIQQLQINLTHQKDPMQTDCHSDKIGTEKYNQDQKMPSKELAGCVEKNEAKVQITKHQKMSNEFNNQCQEIGKVGSQLKEIPEKTNNQRQDSSHVLVLKKIKTNEKFVHKKCYVQLERLKEDQLTSNVIKKTNTRDQKVITTCTRKLSDKLHSNMQKDLKQTKKEKSAAQNSNPHQGNVIRAKKLPVKHDSNVNIIQRNEKTLQIEGYRGIEKSNSTAKFFKRLIQSMRVADRSHHRKWQKKTNKPIPDFQKMSPTLATSHHQKMSIVLDSQKNPILATSHCEDTSTIGPSSKFQEIPSTTQCQEIPSITECQEFYDNIQCENSFSTNECQEIPYRSITECQELDDNIQCENSLSTNQCDEIHSITESQEFYDNILCEDRLSTNQCDEIHSITESQEFYDNILCKDSLSTNQCDEINCITECQEFYDNILCEDSLSTNECQEIPSITECQEIPSITECQEIPSITECQEIPSITECQELDDSKTFSCDICSKSFSSKDAIKRHLPVHREKRFVHNRSQKVNIDQHFNLVHGVKHTCRICSKNFSSEYNLKLHFSVHSKSKHLYMFRDTEFACIICKKTLIEEDGFEKHLLIHCIEKNSASTPFKCIVCGKCFPHKRNLKTHLTYHRKYKPFACRVCSKQFYIKRDLDKHSCMQSKKKTSEKPIVKHTCRICCKKFSTKYNLKLHISDHSKSKHLYMFRDTEFACIICEKTFIEEDGFEKHLLIHCLEKNPASTPFKCILCDKCFPHKRNLRTHLAHHRKYKPYVCGFCSKTFHIKRHRDQHASIHSQSKPFSCDICLKSFPEKTHLRRHLPIHSEKNFVCDICGKSFVQKPNMQRHIFLVHGNKKPFVCEICAMSFKREISLRNHRRIHSADKTFVCDVCDKLYHFKPSLIKHLRDHF